MTKAGEKLLAAARDALTVAKCEHKFKDDVVVDGRRLLHCLTCKATVHVFYDPASEKTFG